MINNRNIIASLIFIMLICNSCIGFRSISLKDKNPTSYIFHVPINKLRDTIKSDFIIDRAKDINDLMNVQDISVKTWNILTSNDYNISKKAKDIFEKEDNKLDLYLYSSTNPIISYSRMYKRFWKKLEYRAEFQLHFILLNDNETKIEIITHNPRVLYWSLRIFNWGHSFVNYRSVEPTTIEEYEILLRIGNLIGEKDMPPLKLPN
jgi:hypothetical protein